MSGFEQLVTSRKQWIDDVLIPWCRAATLKDLQRAEREWTDIAGKIDPKITLWAWAWSRFPGLIVEELSGMDETYPVTVTLRSGACHTGFPDARKSQRGSLVLAGSTGEEIGPFSLDEIGAIQRDTSTDESDR